MRVVLIKRMWAGFLLIFCAIAAAEADECHCPEIVYDDDVMQAEIKSPLYPERYCDFLDCVWEISGKEGYGLSMNIEDFETENKGMDYLMFEEVVHGASEDDRYIERRTIRGDWQKACLNEGTHFVTAKNNGIRLHFHTDNSGFQKRGFKLSWIRHDDENMFCPPNLFYPTDASVNLPMWPAGFNVKTGCAFKLLAPRETNLEVHPLQLGKGSTLVIRDVIHNIKNERLGRMEINEYSTKQLDPNSLYLIKTISNMAIILINKPDTGNDFTHPYEISFRKLNWECNCFTPNINLAAEGQEYNLLSPRYPLGYCSNMNCKTVITNHLKANVTHVPGIEFDFAVIETESNRDKVLIETTKGESVWSMSGVHLKNYVRVPVDAAALRFVTNPSIQSVGFNVTIKNVMVDRDCLCQNTELVQKLGASNGVVTAHIPEKCERIDCWWKIEKKEKDILKVQLNNSFSDNDALSFTNRNSKLIAAPGGVRQDDWKYISYANNGGVREFENGKRDDMNVHYHRYEPDSESSFTFRYDWEDRSEGCACGETKLYAEANKWTELTSPNYPEPYCSAMDCHYTISAPSTYRIAINVTDSALEPGNDFLEIMEGDGESVVANQISVITGYRKIRHLIVSQNETVHLVLRSDYSIQDRGIKLLFTAEAREMTQTLEGSQPMWKYALIGLGLLFGTVGGFVLYRKIKICLMLSPVFGGNADRQTINPAE